jgi:hypothetical protein
MVIYLIVSVVSGILFGLMDALIQANPLARKLNEVFQPIARKSFNPLTGIVIDLIYGFAMAGIFLLLYHGLPGGNGPVKGVSFAVLAWFFRVVMSAASQWVMFDMPVKTSLYHIATGLGEMLILGVFYGLTLKPAV